MKNEADTAKDLQNQKTAISLKTSGVPYSEIAEHLGVDLKTAKRLVARGLEEYYDDHAEVAHRYSGINLARYDRLMRSWLPRALGGKQTVKDPVTGNDVVQVIDPNAEAAHICITAMRDLNRHLGNGQAIRLTHEGPNGGPILTAAVDAMDAARLVREAFGGNAAKSFGAPPHGRSNNATADDSPSASEPGAAAGAAAGVSGGTLPGGAPTE